MTSYAVLIELLSIIWFLKLEGPARDCLLMSMCLGIKLLCLPCAATVVVPIFSSHCEQEKKDLQLNERNWFCPAVIQWSINTPCYHIISPCFWTETFLILWWLDKTIVIIRNSTQSSLFLGKACMLQFLMFFPFAYLFVHFNSHFDFFRIHCAPWC